MYIIYIDDNLLLNILCYKKNINFIYGIHVSNSLKNKNIIMLIVKENLTPQLITVVENCNNIIYVLPLFYWNKFPQPELFLRTT